MSCAVRGSGIEPLWVGSSRRRSLQRPCLGCLRLSAASRTRATTFGGSRRGPPERRALESPRRVARLRVGLQSTLTPGSRAHRSSWTRPESHRLALLAGQHGILMHEPSSRGGSAWNRTRLRSFGGSVAPCAPTRRGPCGCCPRLTPETGELRRWSHHGPRFFGWRTGIEPVSDSVTASRLLHAASRHHTVRGAGIAPALCAPEAHVLLLNTTL